jgi:hypothetical protein
MLTRENLFQEVWTAPVSAVAEKYGISDRGLAKICNKMGVPVPPRGYWARIRSGQKVKKPALPKLRRNQVQAYDLRRSAVHRISKAEPLSQEATVLLQKEQTAKTIRVPATLVSPHPLVAKIARSMRGQEPDRYGTIRPSEGLNIRVSPGLQKRALRIMQALLKAFDNRGYDFRCRDNKDRYHSDSRMHVMLLGEKIAFSLEERSTRRDHEPTEKEKKEARSSAWSYHPLYDYFPSGRLWLEINSWEAPQVKKKSAMTPSTSSRICSINSWFPS